MVYKRFGTVIFIRIIFLCLSIFLLFYLLDETKLVATTFIVFVIIIVQVYSIIHFVERTNREIARFFNSIKYSDFSQSFKTNIKGSAFEELSSSFSEVIEEFRNARTEKEEHFRYLQTVVQHIGTGLLVFTSDGNIELINNSAKRLLKINNIKNISGLSAVNGSLVEALTKIRAGEKILVKIADGNELSQLSIHAAEFKMKGSHYTLASISNIQSELEEKEMEAWQNLIRVLTHEIMNSVTPIISLSSTASQLLEEADKKIKDGVNPGAENLDDVKEALNTIIRRSKGLLRFIDDYRNLTRVPVPNFQIVHLSSLFEKINKLFSEQLKEKNIQFTYTTEPANLEVTADPDLIDQVIINLILNSVHSVANVTEPKISLSGTIDNYGKAVVQVTDNGNGVPEELYEKIFIPFFTTRKEGSGIGLSLSRQIMRLHKGGITVKSTPGVETVFTLRF